MDNIFVYILRIKFFVVIAKILATGVVECPDSPPKMTKKEDHNFVHC